jgi:hypothetical protein
VYGTASPHDQMRKATVWALNEYYAVLHEGGRYLSGQQLSRLQTAVRYLLRCYNALSAEAQATGKVAWRWVPKFHLFEHLGDITSEQVNPSACTCYADEEPLNPNAQFCRYGEVWGCGGFGRSVFATRVVRAWLPQDVVGRLAKVARACHRLAVNRACMLRWRWTLAARLRPRSLRAGAAAASAAAIGGGGPVVSIESDAAGSACRDGAGAAAPTLPQRRKRPAPSRAGPCMPEPARGAPR